MYDTPYDPLYLYHDPFTVHWKGANEWYRTQWIRCPYDKSLQDITDSMRELRIPFYVEWH